MCPYPDYGCKQHFHHISHHGGQRQWGCCCSRDYMPQRFPTREKIIEELQEYLEQLRAEIKGVEERIAELRKED